MKKISVSLVVLSISLCLGASFILGRAYQVRKPVTAAQRVEVGPDAYAADVASLREQLSVVRDYNDDFLSTVYWSLGSVLLLVVILVGYSWFVNFRMADKEGAALRQELIGLVKGQGDSTRDALQTFLNEIVPLRVQIQTANLEHEIKRLQKEIANQKYRYLDWQAAPEIAKKRPYAIKLCTEMAEAALETGGGFALDQSLQHIVDLLRDGVNPGTGYARQLAELLERLPSHHETSANTIRALMEKVQTG